ncbi:hypothetical protein CsSME_00031432 [Camellia sinensis var. sinensis]
MYVFDWHQGVWIKTLLIPRGAQAFDEKFSASAPWLIQGEDRVEPAEEDNHSVIIPNHLQVQSADCSHLSFGSFGSGISAAFSGPFSSRPLKSNIEETSADADADASLVGHSDTTNPEYYGNEPLRTASDGNLVQRTGLNAGFYDSSSASQPEVLKQENTEAPHETHCMFPSSSANYNFDNGQQLNAAFPQTSSHTQNLPPFSSVMTYIIHETFQAYTNSLPSSLLAVSVQPVRESELPYSPFLMTQSMPTKYGSAVSSISGSTISVPEDPSYGLGVEMLHVDQEVVPFYMWILEIALKTVGFSSTQPSAQILPGSNVDTGLGLPQHLAVHPYSQPSLQLGPFASMISYPYLPTSYTYLPSTFQQAFGSGNSTDHQSLAAAAGLPQYKNNNVSVNSRPQSAAIVSGYGGFGSSTSIPSNFPPAAPGPTTIGYDDILSSQYKDSNHSISLQQNENLAMWVHGLGSRIMSAVPASTYYSFQGQSQQGFRQTQQPSQSYGALGYPNFYHSQSGISLEHQQQQQNPRDGPLGSCNEFEVADQGKIIPAVEQFKIYKCPEENLPGCCPVPRGCIFTYLFAGLM